MKTLCVLVGLLFLMGCMASMSNVIQSKSGGTVKIYPIDLDRAWKAALLVLRQNGCEAIEEHRDEGYMLTTSFKNWMPGTQGIGTFIGVWIESINQNAVKVTTVTKRRDPTVLVTSLTETGFHDQFAQAIK